MSYVPVPTDETEPTGSRPAGSAAQEFRALKAHIKQQLAAIATSISSINGTLTTNGSSITALTAALNAFVFDDDLAVVHTTTVTAAGAFAWNKPTAPEGDDWTDATAIFRLWGGGQAGDVCVPLSTAPNDTVFGGQGGQYIEFAIPLDSVDATVNGSVGAGGAPVSSTTSGVYVTGNAGGNTSFVNAGVTWLAYGGGARPVTGVHGTIGGRCIYYPRGEAGNRDASSAIAVRSSLVGGPAGGAVVSGGTLRSPGTSLFGVTGGAALYSTSGGSVAAPTATGAGAGGGGASKNNEDNNTTSGAGAPGRVEIYIVRGKQRGYNTLTVDL